jgi:hypothetical protein
LIYAQRIVLRSVSHNHPVIKEKHMKLKAALLAATLALTAVAHAGELVDKSEPPATPAGGAPEAGIGVAGAVGIAIGVAVIAAIATGGDDDNTTNSNSNSNSNSTL